MIKLGKEIKVGDHIKHEVDKYNKNFVGFVVMKGKNRGFYTPYGFEKIKQRTEYEVVEG